MNPTILQLMVTQRVERNRFLGFSQIRKFLLNKSADWWSQHGAPVRILCFIQYLYPEQGRPGAISIYTLKPAADIQTSFISKNI